MKFFFFFQAEDGIRDYKVTGVQTCALPILPRALAAGMTRPPMRTSPTPIKVQLIWASGARSPEAPTEPLAGMQGYIPALRRAISASITERRMPEAPRERPLILAIIMP